MAKDNIREQMKIYACQEDYEEILKLVKVYARCLSVYEIFSLYSSDL